MEAIGNTFHNEEMYYDFMQEVLILLKKMNKISTRPVTVQWGEQICKGLAVKFWKP
jgi:hypothetical protein